jgi:DNA-binding response OmpR family regulator
MRILIVRDEAKAAALRRGLTEPGFAVAAVGTGEEGLFRAPNLDCELVILEATLTFWDQR